MLTTIVLVLVLLAIAVVAAWWFLDFDMPEIMIPVAPARYRRRAHLLVRHGTRLGDRPLAAADWRLRAVSPARQLAPR
ncbi:MAG: hypothetical protein ACRECM_09065 [Methyloceanibacter sp.]